MARSFVRSDRQRNALFECDSEIILIGEALWGLSMDEFSPEEDLFTCENPVRLGNNLAIATLSDLLAAGAEPQFFMQSVSLPKGVEADFVDGLMAGVRSVLNRLDCALCGGDVGTADPWRFCGFGMGPVRSIRPLTHRLSDPPHTLWITGTLGDANLAALQNAPTPAFELRNSEAGVIRSHASACVDTSGGFLDALWLLHKQNPTLRFDIRLDDVPMAADVLKAAKSMGFPAESALLGGAGEYELLFAVPQTADSKFRENALADSFTCIGATRKDADAGIRLCRPGGPPIKMDEAPPCPRSAATIKEHVHEVMAMANHLFRTFGQ